MNGHMAMDVCMWCNEADFLVQSHIPSQLFFISVTGDKGQSHVKLWHQP